MSLHQAEAEVELRRRDLESTLGRLSRNLRPKRLAGEVMSGGDWLPHYWRFAKQSHVAKAIIGTAATAILLQAARRFR